MKRLGVLALSFALFAVPASPPANGGAADKDKGGSAKTVVVVMETTMGTIEIELNAAKAPITVKNFLAYADDKFFDGTIFHRVIPDFMIQGGGFKPDITEKKTRAPIRNEAGNGLSNVRGTIAMARTGDPNSATAQFYINVADNSGKLDKTEDNPGYCVFGKVIKGMNVADKISEVRTHSVLREVVFQGQPRRVRMDDVPVKPVVIKSVRRKK